MPQSANRKGLLVPLRASHVNPVGCCKSRTTPESRQRLDILGNVKHWAAPSRHLFRCGQNTKSMRAERSTNDCGKYMAEQKLFSFFEGSDHRAVGFVGQLQFHWVDESQEDL